MIQQCNGYDMCSILDIDLDYFNLISNPAQKLSKLLKWASCPIFFVVENHHEVLPLWKKYVKKEHFHEPEYLLHVDEHHDMMDEKSKPNIGNVVYHAMKTWLNLRVHWMVDNRIDSPTMWLSEDAWKSVSARLTWSSHRPRNWAKPRMVSVCTSPEFVPMSLHNDLMAVIEQKSIRNSQNRFSTLAKRE
jgi:hypothetical protein